MIRRLFAALAVMLILAAGSVAPGHAADLFGKPDQPADGAAAPAQPAPPPPQIVLPAPLRPILAEVVRIQTKMNAAMRAQLLKARDGDSLRPAVIIVLFAFLYGVAHAVGPGHGKVVIGGYFLTRRAQLMQGFAMSGVAALVQALSAIALVGIPALLFEFSTAAILDQAADIEIVSYGAIVAIGAWMAWGVITGRKHSHGPDDHHDHDHHNHDHGHDHGHDHEHHHRRPRGSEGWRLLATGAVVGLRPCSGAILVLLFSLANGIVAIGILATFAMAVGVAITVSLVSLASLGVQRAGAALNGRTKWIAEKGYSALALGGALLIALFGLLELVGVWTGVLTPGAG